MKNAEELFNEFATSTDGIIVQYEANFIEALSEHDNELISEIEKLIEDAEARKLVDINYQEKWTARIKALTEIINLIKGKK